MRFEFTDPAPAKGNGGPRDQGSEMLLGAAPVKGAGSGWVAQLCIWGSSTFGTFRFGLGFYLTDYSLPPYLPLFNCFFFLLPSLLTPFLLSSPSRPMSCVTPHHLHGPSVLTPHLALTPPSCRPHRLAALFSPEPWQQGL